MVPGVISDRRLGLVIKRKMPGSSMLPGDVPEALVPPEDTAQFVASIARRVIPPLRHLPRAFALFAAFVAAYGMLRLS